CPPFAYDRLSSRVIATARYSKRLPRHSTRTSEVNHGESRRPSPNSRSWGRIRCLPPGLSTFRKILGSRSVGRSDQSLPPTPPFKVPVNWGAVRRGTGANYRDQIVVRR